jgi:hypothetical protein
MFPNVIKLSKRKKKPQESLSPKIQVEKFYIDFQFLKCEREKESQSDYKIRIL